MNDTLVTLAGYVGSDVTVRDAGGGVPVAGFRVATTPRRFSRKDDAWVDGDTQWYSVSAWRQLAENCALSLKRGDPVVLHGRLSAETWRNKANIEVSSMAIELVWIGHDLSRGTSSFVKLTRTGEGSADGGTDGATDAGADSRDVAGEVTGDRPAQGLGEPLRVESPAA